MKRLELALFPGPLAEAPAETLAVAIPEDERPLGGHAGFVDWRLGGALSRQIRSGFVSGAVGEAVLLPAQRPLIADRILLFGVGPAESPGRVLQRAFAVAAEKLLSLRSPRATLALPRAVQFELDGEFLLRGCIQALSTLRGDRQLGLVLPDAHKHDIAIDAVLAALSAEAERRRVRLELTWLDAPADRAATAAALPAAAVAEAESA